MSTVKDVAAATARVVAIDPPSANRAVVKPREYPALHHGSKREKSIARLRQRRNKVPAGPSTDQSLRGVGLGHPPCLSVLRPVQPVRARRGGGCSRRSRCRPWA